MRMSLASKLLALRGFKLVPLFRACQADCDSSKSGAPFESVPKALVVSKRGAWFCRTLQNGARARWWSQAA